MRDDLDHEVRFRQVLQQGRMVHLTMLIAHARGNTENRSIMKRTDQRFAFMAYLWACELLGEAPDLAPPGNRRIIIKIHGVHIAAFLHQAVRTREPDRDDLARSRYNPQSRWNRACE